MYVPVMSVCGCVLCVPECGRACPCLRPAWLSASRCLLLLSAHHLRNGGGRPQPKEPQNQGESVWPLSVPCHCTFPPYPATSTLHPSVCPSLFVVPCPSYPVYFTVSLLPFYFTLFLLFCPVLIMPCSCNLSPL